MNQMMRNLLLILVGGMTLHSANAQSRPLFTIEQSAIVWSRTVENSDSSSGDVVNSLSTQVDDFYFMASWDGWNVYLYPHAADGLTISYMLTPDFELGLDLSYSFTRSASESSVQNTYGLWVTYYQEINRGTMEYTVASSRAKGVMSDDNGVEVAASQFTYGVDADWLNPLTEGFYYIGGASWYKTNTAWSGSTLTQSELGLRLLGFRAEW